ncbi:hypothetical protein POM88_038384 [Heracleum sosnowskyi]|uniref:Uncharacterized protein n=1 Tax=Heracleum sosnowskyi TaxID=360622 RepID=A0AAD8M8A4_9APIA|nr:hypothetical protein POM88_038384 [Heracleum sosnowskyi]
MQSGAHFLRWYLQAAQAWVPLDLIMLLFVAAAAAGGGGVGLCFLRLREGQVEEDMEVKPAVAARAILVGGVAAFAKIGGAVKAAGGVKMGVAATAMTAAASAAISGSKNDQHDASK